MANTQKWETKSLDTDIWTILLDELIKIPPYFWGCFFLQIISFGVLLHFCCTIKNKILGGRDLTIGDRTIKIEYPQLDEIHHTVRTLESHLKGRCPGAMPMTVSNWKSYLSFHLTIIKNNNFSIVVS